LNLQRIKVASLTESNLTSRGSNLSSEEDQDRELLRQCNKTTQKTLNRTFLSEEAGLESVFRFKVKSRALHQLTSRHANQLDR